MAYTATFEFGLQTWEWIGPQVSSIQNDNKNWYVNNGYPGELSWQNLDDAELKYV